MFKIHRRKFTFYTRITAHKILNKLTLNPGTYDLRNRHYGAHRITVLFDDMTVQNLKQYYVHASTVYNCV